MVLGVQQRAHPEVEQALAGVAGRLAQRAVHAQEAPRVAAQRYQGAPERRVLERAPELLLREPLGPAQLRAEQLGADHRGQATEVLLADEVTGARPDGGRRRILAVCARDRDDRRMQAGGVQHVQRVDEVEPPHQVLAEHEIPVTSSDRIRHIELALDPDRAHLIFRVLEHRDRQSRVPFGVVDDQDRELAGAHHQTAPSPPPNLRVAVSPCSDAQWRAVV